MRPEQLAALEARGIVVPDYADHMPDIWRKNARLAQDAQPQLVTAQNVGVPAWRVNLLDPKTIRALVTPMRAAQIFSEEKKGDWTKLTAQFPVVESMGYVSSYGDYNNNGGSGSNYNWVPRQSYHFQIVSQYGDREVDIFGEAGINYIADLNFSMALIMSKFQNASYFFGVQGLQNYGALNDPNLIAPIVPTTKLAGGTTWAVATAVEIFQDVLLLFEQAQAQLGGLIDRDTKMTLALDPVVEPNLSKVTSYTLASVRKAIQDNWPNMRILTAPEYATTSGRLVQLVVDEIDGDKTAYAAFTEKMRAGRVIADTSWYRQKKVGGTWGTIIRRPVAIAQMLGI